ncbi:hypothetical protein [Deinococcus indicus]|nr:hypothetical protein [Deinococcus indicus]
MNAFTSAALAGALGLPGVPAPRLRADMTVHDAILALSADGNPGGVAALCALATCHEQIGPGALLDVDTCGLSGMQVYLLLRQCGSPLRMAALLAMTARVGLPTPAELIRDLGEPLTPLLERAITTLVPAHFPAFAGLNLTRPPERA